MWTAYFRWAKLDPSAYASLPLIDRLAIFRHTFPTALVFRYGVPARKWIRRRLPAWMHLSLLERVGTREDGMGWYRATDRRSARLLSDAQPDDDRAGQAVLREGELMLLDRRGHIQGFVISDEEESVIVLRDGQGWA
jgi:hypothetical protein